MRNPYKVESLHPEFEVLLENAPAFADIPEAFSDEIFERAASQKPIFNGTLLCVQDYSPKKIITYTLSYKEYLAASHFPNYPHAHSPLAVSGWVIHKDRVLFGVRSDKVMYFSGHLELVPSGGIDARAIEESQEINYKRALLAEFEEETGLSEACIKQMNPELLIYSHENSLYDIALSIELKDDPIDCDSSNEEYSSLFWVPLKELHSFTEENKERIISTSLALIHHKLLS